VIRIQGIPMVAARLQTARRSSESVRETTRLVKQDIRRLREDPTLETKPARAASEGIASSREALTSHESPQAFQINVRSGTPGR
jgi:hypothetical protein